MIPWPAWSPADRSERLLPGPSTRRRMVRRALAGGHVRARASPTGEVGLAVENVAEG